MHSIVTPVKYNITIYYNQYTKKSHELFCSIISFATVGFGDKFPTADDPLLLIAVTCYLVWGMILMTTMFSIVSSYLRTVSIKYTYLNCIS